jgi:hypothetical protein
VPLNFASAALLFTGSEEELARALSLSLADLRALRTNPQRATPQQLARLGQVLVERGTGMARVGEMLIEDSST